MSLNLFLIWFKFLANSHFFTTSRILLFQNTAWPVAYTRVGTRFNRKRVGFDAPWVGQEFILFFFNSYRSIVYLFIKLKKSKQVKQKGTTGKNQEKNIQHKVTKIQNKKNHIFLFSSFNNEHNKPNHR